MSFSQLRDFEYLVDLTVKRTVNDAKSRIAYFTRVQLGEIEFF